jgi:multidrug resistance efflux pump
MNVMLNRLDPNVPDPIESRRRAAGRMVRTAYAVVVFGILGFFVVYFGAPLVFLSGPGVVSAPTVVVSLPYVVRVEQIYVDRGAEVTPGEVIGRVWSPQQHTIVASFLQSLAEVAGRSAELRIKVRVAKESLDVAKSYLRVTEEAVERLASSTVASTSFRVEVFRERAAASKAVIAQEAEIAETEVQLTNLEAFDRQIRDKLMEAERNFAGGRVASPIAGIIATTPARIGQSLAAGLPIAEIQDPREIFVDWYIPNQRLLDPRVGNDVVVVYGNWRMHGTIGEILPVSEVYGGARPSLTRERVASQVARVRLEQGTAPPALNSTVVVHMYYTRVAAWIAGILISVLGLERTAENAS